MPSACVISAMYCACKSVAKPGYSSVVISTLRSRPVPRTRKDVASGCVTSTPHCCNLDTSAPTCSGLHRVTVRSPPVIAPATRNVPASMRSAIIVCSAPCSRSTPCMRMVDVPAPSILAPILISRSARSTTSGSRAALRSTVSPLASTAAIIKSSVPVTVMRSKCTTAPRSPSGATASIYPCAWLMVAPNCSRPKMCRLMGRAPMAQPPGRETLARPERATRGPSTRLDARMVLTSS